MISVLQKLIDHLLSKIGIQKTIPICSWFSHFTFEVETANFEVRKSNFEVCMRCLPPLLSLPPAARFHPPFSTLTALFLPTSKSPPSGAGVLDLSLAALFQTIWFSFGISSDMTQPTPTAPALWATCCSGDFGLWWLTTDLESLVFWAEANKWVLQRFLRQISGQIQGGDFGDRSLLFFVFLFRLVLVLSIYIPDVELSQPSVGIVSLYLGEFLPNLYG